ncbi:DUF1707 domain-containing protein [Tessaracoccus sp. Z1128]
MSAFPQHPTTHVTEAARDRAVAHLQACYAQGQLDERELDRRLDQALGARDRAELNRSLAGLARIAPAPLRPAAPGQPSPVDNVGAGLVQLSGLFTSFVGPAVVKAVATPGSRVWWEAARALSLQVTMMVAGFAALVIGLVLGFEGLMGLVWLAWFAATLAATVRAFNGQSGTGRFERVLLAKPTAPRGQLPRTRYNG